MATYTYLPWVRQGLIGAVTTQPAQPGRLELAVHAQVSGGGGRATKPVNILLFGPVDVTGIDARQVIRTDPPHLTSDVEPNYFPLIEFDQPSLPWLFTPAVPDNQNHLKPWICLIAIEKREGVELSYQQGQLLPVLAIKVGAKAELPDLSEAWVWAHVQVGAASTEADIQKALESQPERTLSRLMCPRHLKPKTAYYACVVPTYRGGVQAGLGEPIDKDHALDPAWMLGSGNTPDQIQLPVYYHWEFATGAQGDFEALVWQLDRKKLTLEEVGTRKLDIGQAGYGLPASAAVDLEGALLPDAAPDDGRVGPSPDYQARLQALLNETAAPPMPVLPPPIYGRWHAAQRTIPDTLSATQTRDRPWLRAINLDPRYRVAAGLGAQVVREQQEQLMASAWDQVGDIERANQMIRQAQLARAASASIHQQRLGLLDAPTFLLITGPVQPRVRYTSAAGGPERTAYGHVQASALPRAVTGAQFRRILRLRGKLARRFGIAGAEQRNRLITGMNQRQINPAPHRWPMPNGMVTVESLIGKSPCNASPDTFVQELLDQWPPERLITIIDAALTILANGQTEIAALNELVRLQLERAAKNLTAARHRLQEYMGRATTGVDLKLILALYAPAWSLIAQAHWIVMRVASGANPPGVIAQLDQAMNALPGPDNLRLILFGLAAIIHEQSVEPCDDEPLRLKPPLPIDELKTSVHEKLNPRVTIAARVGALIEAPGWKAEELDLVLAAPDFPAPMYKALAELAQDWLLPGLERVPPNTLTLLESNTQFIEAYLAGLNHEMSRELLWRGYPTDQRGSYFRQFWDPSGRFPTTEDQAQHQANLEKGKDIPPIHEWGDEQLGSNFGKPRTQPGAPAAQAGPRPIVLLMRGDLLRRYPRASIFMVRAEWKNNLRNPILVTEENDAEQVLHPLFRGELPPDITFLGFLRGKDEAVGKDDPAANDPGWFIVIEQQATEPRYGLDETAANSNKPNRTWRDLAWPHVNLAEEHGYIKLALGAKADFPMTAQKGPNGEGWKWSSDTDSAQVACITLQGPVRVYIHASDLL